MNIQHKTFLSALTTMGLGGDAAQLVEVYSPDDVRQAVAYARQHKLPWYVLGGGSNTLARDDGFDGLVILNKIPGINVIDQTKQYTTFTVGAGELWDAFVAQTVDRNLSGIECLSAIPGTVGAAPVQNIGAYGQEVASAIAYVDAYDTKNDTFVRLQNAECEFSYRHSIFRGREQGRYIITAVTMRLRAVLPQPPFYKAIETYLREHSIANPSVRQLRDAVIAIRANKLPDPRATPNTGSFFKNAIVSREIYERIVADYSNVPHYDLPDGNVKIPTGWLIERSGLKGMLYRGMRVYDKNALVLVNESAKSYDDLAAARQHIINTVQTKFGITIQQEPLEICTKKLF